LTRFQAVATGDAVTFKVKSGSSANVKVAIYADSTGEPGALMNAVNTDNPIVAGWNDITISSTPIVAGNYYWLAINSDTMINCAISSPGSMLRYKAAPYAGFNFPNPAGIGYGSATGIMVLMAGWSGGPTPLTITTNTLPDGTIGNAYSQTLQAAGGSGSYTWSLISGSLPPGLGPLTAGGLIAGTPTTAGTYNFTVQVDDGLTTVSKPLSITVSSSQKLVGADDAAITGPLSPGYISLTRFQAVATGDAVTFKVKSGSSANVKVAIYDDSTGEPGALVNAVNTDNPIVAGWNEITIASTPIVAGNYYWLAINSDTMINCAISSPGSMLRYKAAPYAGFNFPNPAGIGYGSATGIMVLMAGWN
jgi:hypothetical protein